MIPQPLERQVDVCCDTMSRVVDSRYMEGQDARRRRRLCTICGRRWSTYEVTDQEAETGPTDESRMEWIEENGLGALVAARLAVPPKTQPFPSHRQLIDQLATK